MQNPLATNSFKKCKIKQLKKYKLKFKKKKNNNNKSTTIDELKVVFRLCYKVIINPTLKLPASHDDYTLHIDDVMSGGKKRREQKNIHP